MAKDSLETLIALSARIGGNLDLVQAGGGNTSIKEDGVLWVKASGKSLSRAASDDMFLPVPMDEIEKQLAARDERFPEYQTRSGVSLRPSVETAVHAVLNQKVVIHVHSVRVIAWATQANGQNQVTPRLAGLEWSWIPYTHPGIPLAIRIREESERRRDVLILENHGLVVAAESCSAAEELLGEVERRLDAGTRPHQEANLPQLQKMTRDTDWEFAADSEVHALATNPVSLRLAAGGTLFPDQCVYLGPAAAVAEHHERLQEAAKRYETRYGFAPAFLLVDGIGTATKRDMKPAARELLVALKRVIQRIPGESQAIYLPVDQVARLMNWDAEKYRIAMAQREEEQECSNEKR